MAITAAQVKELREMTGLGMMECKQALTETDGDKDAAIELLRKKAGAKVEKKAGRTAADGVISIAVNSGNKVAAIVEVNTETDFVAKGDEFRGFASDIAARIAADKPADVEALKALPIKDGSDLSISKALEALVQKLGEKMDVRRFATIASDNTVGSYIHGGKIGVIVEVEGGSEDLAKDLAMHIAAARPQFVTPEEVPEDVKAKEREIFVAQAKESGKPDNIIEKMVEGRLNKFLAEICLTGQAFVKDPDTTIEKLLSTAGARVVKFVRYEVGEGIEKKQEDFAAEVMAQVKGE
jgi:elongation factor Ts